MMGSIRRLRKFTIYFAMSHVSRLSTSLRLIHTSSHSPVASRYSAAVVLVAGVTPLKQNWLSPIASMRLDID